MRTIKSISMKKIAIIIILIIATCSICFAGEQTKTAYSGQYKIYDNIKINSVLNREQSFQTIFLGVTGLTKFEVYLDSSYNKSIQIVMDANKEIKVFEHVQVAEMPGLIAMHDRYKGRMTKEEQQQYDAMVSAAYKDNEIFQTDLSKRKMWKVADGMDISSNSATPALLLTYQNGVIELWLGNWEQKIYSVSGEIQNKIYCESWDKAGSTPIPWAGYFSVKLP